MLTNLALIPYDEIITEKAPAFKEDALKPTYARNGHVMPRVGLEVFASICSQPAVFPSEVYKFEYVEVSGSGAVAYLEKSLDWIVEKYGKGW